jgi:hypothetical protein
MGPTTCWTSGSAAIASRSRRAAASCAGDEVSPATSNGPLKPAPKPSVSVRAARRELRRIVAGVGDAEPQREERDREEQQHEETADQRDPRPPLERAAPARPETLLGVALLLRARQRELVDRVADEAEHSREQGDGRRHHEQHRE